jgi:hypothetical protein
MSQVLESDCGVLHHVKVCKDRGIHADLGPKERSGALWYIRISYVFFIPYLVAKMGLGDRGQYRYSAPDWYQILTN